MSTASYEAQRAIYEALVHFEPVTALVTGVFDSVPENQPYPYIKIGGGDSETWVPTMFDKAGRENLVNVHIWSRYKGMLEVKRIAQEVTNRLAPPDPRDRFRLNMQPWEWYSTVYDFGEFLEDPDGVTRHAVLRFRVKSQKADV